MTIKNQQVSEMKKKIEMVTVPNANAHAPATRNYSASLEFAKKNGGGFMTKLLSRSDFLFRSKVFVSRIMFNMSYTILIRGTNDAFCVIEKLLVTSTISQMCESRSSDRRAHMCGFRMNYSFASCSL